MAEAEPLWILARTSLDLRGVRPTEEEMDAVLDRPQAVEDLVEGFLVDPRFEDRMVSLYGELYGTVADEWPASAIDYGLPDEAAFTASMGEEPLRLVARVAAEDRPWTDIVTADWTMANEVLAVPWPVDYPEGATGWMPAHYTDGRPAAGVLATNGLWWHYGSTASNANRGRARALARLFLCEDYLQRPLTFDASLSLLDEAAVAAAIEEDPGCVNCHASLEPLASHFYGFWWDVQDSPADLARYHRDRELLWREVTGTAPGYFGQPSESLADLGRAVANDPRFPNCAVAQGFFLLLRRWPELADTDQVVAHREAFLDGGLRARALYRSLVHDPDYRAAVATGGDPSGGVPAKLVTPDLLASQIEGLTGYRWTSQNFDMLRTDKVGVRLLAGGADGVAVTTAAQAPSATLLLVQGRLAQLAADAAVAADKDLERGGRRLFVDVDFDEAPDDPAVLRQVQRLYRRVLTRDLRLDHPEVLETVELYAALVDLGENPEQAWADVLSALLRHPDLLIY